MARLKRYMNLKLYSLWFPSFSKYSFEEWPVFTIITVFTITIITIAITVTRYIFYVVENNVDIFKLPVVCKALDKIDLFLIRKSLTNHIQYGINIFS